MLKIFFPGDHFFDVKWTPELSATTSFVALRSSSGKITLVSSKITDPIKIAMAENETIAIDVVTQNAPGCRQFASSFLL